MKIKLSNKIMSSYILLLLIAFTISMGISTTVVKNRLTTEAQIDLKEQGEAILLFIEESRFDLSEPRKLLTYLKNSHIGGLISSDIFVLSEGKKVVYASNESMPIEILRDAIIKDNPDFIRVVYKLDGANDQIGYILLITEVKHIDQIVRVLRNGLIIGMLIAITIGIILAYIMKKSIVSPIKSLRDDMIRTTMDPSYKARPITTSDEIEELYKAYTHMNTIIMDNMEDGKRFFQNASHELKTPLMSIQGYAEAIKDGVVEGDEVDSSLDIIINKSQILGKTVEEIIYLSKLMNREVSYKFLMTDVVQLTQSAIVDYSLLAKENNIQIQVECDVDSIMMSLDDQKMYSVITNLLSNALRYAKTMIKVIVKDDETQCTILIMDDGIGLKNGEESKVFERFYKGEGGKSGIGLAIVSEIVKGHDGIIRAGNHIGGGAAFEIILRKNKKIVEVRQ